MNVEVKYNVDFQPEITETVKGLKELAENIVVNNEVAPKNEGVEIGKFARFDLDNEQIADINHRFFDEFNSNDTVVASNIFAGSDSFEKFEQLA